jgi:predicted nucleotidyltransferase
MQHFVKEIVRRLTEARVEFVIVGGVSGVLQGAPIVTVDLDLCYHRTSGNIARLASALAPLGARLRGLPPDLPFVFDERALTMGTNFTLNIGDEDLDLLGEMAGIGGYEQIIGQALEMAIEGVTVKVLPLAQLIITKEAAGRAKDLAVLPILKATLELRQAQGRAQQMPPEDT